ncbi:TetR/AcrR family transcriptional regulator [Antrihabitans stalactiti]|uniref:TetR/AcrR family transcriptional regulator n=1 Tax=Antrihabitans stalactiti TaxID=2584121 RepID=UPI001F1165ED|nr:TetR/AcrR family transcriptional regulator [Antrihabitans stalactiti]
MPIYYFGTKEAMLVAALETQRPDISAVFAGVADAAALRDRLYAFCMSNQAGANSTSVKVLLQVLGAACVPGSPYAEYANDAIATFVKALAAALARLESVDDPEVVATLLISGLRGIIQDRIITGHAERTDRAAKRLIHMAVPDGPLSAQRTGHRGGRAASSA